MHIFLSIEQELLSDETLLRLAALLELVSTSRMYCGWQYPEGEIAGKKRHYKPCGSHLTLTEESKLRLLDYSTLSAQWKEETILEGNSSLEISAML